MEHVLLQECFRLESIFCVWRCSRDEKYNQVCSNYTHLSQGDPKCRFNYWNPTTTCLLVLGISNLPKKTQVKSKKTKKLQTIHMFSFGLGLGNSHVFFFQMLKPEWFKLRFPVLPLGFQSPSRSGRVGFPGGEVGSSAFGAGSGRSQGVGWFGWLKMFTFKGRVY